MNTGVVIGDIAQVDADAVVLNLFEGAAQPRGAVTAALFSAEFVGKTPWVHIDIAGPVCLTKRADT